MKPLPLNISNDTLNIIIGIATLIIGLIAFGTEFGGNKYLRFTKSLWFRIPTLVLFSLIIIWATVIKDKNNDVRNSNELRERDSVNQINFNKSLSKASAATSTANAETMAKYYLKYDSIQHKIEKIVRDSSKKQITELDLNPELNTSHTEGRLSNDTLYLATTFAASQAAVYNVKYTSYYILRKNFLDYSDNNLQLLPGKYQNAKSKLTIDEPKELGKTFYNPEFKLTPYIVYIYFKGTYENQKGKVFNFESLTYYSVQDKKNAFLSDNEYKWIYNYIQKNEK